MKSLVIATLLAASAFSASATPGNGEAYGAGQENIVSSKTRAEVIAELREARAAGTIAFGEAGLKRIDTHPAPSTSTLTRAQVVAELREAQAAGTITFGEADIKRFNARSTPSTSTLTRAEVRMEVAELAAQGKLNPNKTDNGGIYRN